MFNKKIFQKHRFRLFMIKIFKSTFCVVRMMTVLSWVTTTATMNLIPNV